MVAGFAEGVVSSRAKGDVRGGSAGSGPCAGAGFSAMSTFSESQRQAKLRTRLLGWMFVAGALVTVISACLLAIGVVHLYGMLMKAPVSVDLEKIGWIAGVAALVVAVGTVATALRIVRGGEAIARLLGGEPVPRDSRDPRIRTLWNVVEEISISSGLPRPGLFIIDCPSINAFAAGADAGAAVIGVTQGAVERLDRDELQGVIAHEFSHIAHQDTRINGRAVVAIGGLMALGTIGWIVVRYVGPGIMALGTGIVSGKSSSRGSKGQAGEAVAMLAVFLAFIAAGLGVMGIGSLMWGIGSAGVLYGRVIQAAISRGREYLADATAVDYTRNPDGLAGALRKIRDSDSEAMPGWAASEFNHFFFTSSIGTILESHPPTRERIERLVALGARRQPGD